VPSVVSPRLRLRVLSAIPFGSELLMQLALPGGADVTVDVYDVRGRAVRSLQRGPLTAGLHPIRWDGMLPTGRPAASGVYFIHARADDRAVSKRVVLVR
ncbi:MAG TPA: FlgD immunoglobulin-like domain containing protein, partial [Candidatus Eisenbacteria bacterium]